jgi:hypothetical protein
MRVTAEVLSAQEAGKYAKKNKKKRGCEKVIIVEPIIWGRALRLTKVLA